MKTETFFEPADLIDFLSNPKNSRAAKENRILDFVGQIVEIAKQLSGKKRGRRTARKEVRADIEQFSEALNSAVLELTVDICQYRIALQNFNGTKPLLPIKARLADNLLLLAEQTSTAAFLTETQTIQPPSREFLEALRTGQIEV